VDLNDEVRGRQIMELARMALAELGEDPGLVVGWYDADDGSPLGVELSTRVFTLGRDVDGDPDRKPGFAMWAIGQTIASWRLRALGDLRDRVCFTCYMEAYRRGWQEVRGCIAWRHFMQSCEVELRDDGVAGDRDGVVLAGENTTDL